MTIELIISLAALAAAVFAAVRSFFGDEKTKNRPGTFFNGEKAGNTPDTRAGNTKKEGVTEDVFKKTLQSIEDYRKRS